MNKIFVWLMIIIGCFVIIKQGNHINNLEKQVLELGDINCSRMASFDQKATGYHYTIKNGCIFIYE
jgi:hypothetical protein